MEDGVIAYMTINPIHITAYVVSEAIASDYPTREPGPIVFIKGVEGGQVFQETPLQINNILSKMGHTILPYIPKKRKPKQP